MRHTTREATVCSWSMSHVDPAQVELIVFAGARLRASRDRARVFTDAHVAHLLDA